MFRHNIVRLPTLARCRCFATGGSSLLNAAKWKQRGRLYSAEPPTAVPTANIGLAERPVYSGPLTATFRRLKIFSLATLTLSSAMAPLMFVIESNLPIPARFALAFTALGTSGISTYLVAWCGRPYVTTLTRLPDGSLEMTTLTLGLHKRITHVHDPTFLVETRRPFAKWELAEVINSPPKSIEEGSEETVAETMDKDGQVLGKWIVRWGPDGEGTCYEVGQVTRHFNVHEELLN